MWQGEPSQTWCCFDNITFIKMLTKVNICLDFYRNLLNFKYATKLCF